VPAALGQLQTGPARPGCTHIVAENVTTTVPVTRRSERTVGHAIKARRWADALKWR
jgi:hypothetical protein